VTSFESVCLARSDVLDEALVELCASDPSPPCSGVCGSIICCSVTEEEDDNEKKWEAQRSL
jgi:hypothetical protein